MRICFITPNNFSGKIPRNFKNCRTEYAWMVALDATNIPIQSVLYSSVRSSWKGNYDVGIVILPKKLDGMHLDILLSSIKTCCKKIAFMQEGPQWYFQDYTYSDQINFLNFISEMDFLLVHNTSDIPYFKGLFKKPTFNLQSLIIEDSLKSITKSTPNGCPIIGGNFCSWYSGLDSYFVAKNFNQPISVPSMGRRIEHEEHFPNLNHLSYMDWYDWMVTLKDFSYGIHLMRTHAAGTFALNCAYWGIPCIGYKGLDTQEKLHPQLTVNVGDIEKANELAIKLKNDKIFYNYCSYLSLANYRMCYTENVWLQHWKTIENQII